jgi:uncharacterized protein (DUF427 family)
MEPFPRRVRAVLGGETIVDSDQTLLMFEIDHLPVYYFPIEDVRTDLLEASDHATSCPRKGDASYQSIQVGDRVAQDAVWRYEEPIEGCPDISGHVGIYWDALDSWWEEADEVFVHPRDPYHRVDVLRGARDIRVEVNGEVLAESARPLMLFETGLPTRYYLPRSDVALGTLSESDTVTRCPYKGVATYFSIEAGGKTHDDLAWSYLAPIPECSKVEHAIAFHNEHVDLYVDGELQERPQTNWS